MFISFTKPLRVNYLLPQPGGKPVSDDWPAGHGILSPMNHIIDKY
jgi:hypothetical protein